jgi:hypothetical protein
MMMLHESALIQLRGGYRLWGLREARLERHWDCDNR